MNSLAHQTLTFTQSMTAPLKSVWDAYADPDQRSQWSVPAGEALVHSDTNFRIGGCDSFKCGPPESLDFHGTVNYIQIVPQSLIVYTEAVTSADGLLAVALLTWKFEAHGQETLILLTNQLTSFVGDGMIEGNRNGHTQVLRQLRDFTEGHL